ncbi:hypothetical protein FACS1894103_4590 [Campylobacterota bacterium]|nr:hypothetical protein FACS1894103_4590 [Campylobacterota bacterium]
MKRFIIKLGVFAAPFITVYVLILTVAYYRNYAPYYLYVDKYNSFLLGASDAVSIGNLPDKHGIHSFAFGGDSYRDIKTKIEYILANNSAVNTIYISINDYGVSEYSLVVGNYNRWRTLFVRQNYGNVFEYINERYIKYFHAVANNLEAIFHPRIVEALEKIGIIDPPPQTIFTDLSASARIEQTKRYTDNHFQARSEAMAQALVDILELCKKNNIALVGIKLPYAVELIDLIEKNPQYQLGAEEIVKSYGIPVLDYRNIFVDHPDYLDDALHVSTDGAQELMKVFAKDIQRLRDDGYIK